MLDIKPVGLQYSTHENTFSKNSCCHDSKLPLAGLRHRGRARRTAAPDSKREQLFDPPEIPKREERLATLLKERPDPKPEEEKSGKTFVLVSGLPRSGTSLTMQMLEAGGLPVMTDAQRVADVDNPRGYYEWEAIKQIGKKPELLDDAAVEGRAIKCISMLLPQMPARHQYKVIFMTRPVAEVVASQKAMTARSRAGDFAARRISWPGTLA